MSPYHKRCPRCNDNWTERYSYTDSSGEWIRNVPHHFSSGCGLVYMLQYGTIEQELSSDAKFVWYVHHHKCGVFRRLGEPIVPQHINGTSHYFGNAYWNLIELPWLPYTASKEDVMKILVLL